MEIRDEITRDVHTMFLSGRLNASTASALEDHLTAAIDKGGRKFILELSGLDYISSAGLRVLLMAAKKLKEAEGRLVLSALQPQVKDVFEVAGFTALFPIFPGKEEAFKTLK